MSKGATVGIKPLNNFDRGSASTTLTSARVAVCYVAVICLSGIAGVVAYMLSSSPASLLLACLSPLIFVHWFVAIRPYGFLTPDGLFSVSQVLMVVGTLQLVNFLDPIERQYSHVVVLGASAYFGASLVVHWIENRGKAQERHQYQVTICRPDRTLLSLLAFSLCIVIGYCIAVGYSAFYIGFKGQIEGVEADVATLRLNSYAGTRYLFPGYVNQFKNVILPGLSVVFVTWAWSSSQRQLSMKLLSAICIVLSVAGLLWTGQRGAFVAFTITTIVYLVLLNCGRMTRSIVLVLLISLPPMLAATVVLGRGDSASGGIVERFINDNQASGIAGFRYTANLPTQWGYEWWQSIVGLSPTNRGSTLAGEIFATLYGSTRGTSPPSLWGSVHYNFDTLGVLIIAVVLGLVAQVWTSRWLRRRVYNSLELMGLAGAAVTFGTWIADGPIALFNAGIVAYLFLWKLGRGRRDVGLSLSTSNNGLANR